MRDCYKLEDILEQTDFEFENDRLVLDISDKCYPNVDYVFDIIINGKIETHGTRSKNIRDELKKVK